MESENIKSTVQQWIDAGYPYEQGVRLYQLYGKNNNLKAIFPGREIKYATKIIYELCKSVGLTYKSIPQRPAPVVPQKVTPSALPMEESENSPFSADISHFPPIIKRLIHEYAETFQLRSKTHLTMAQMPPANTQTVKVRRSELFSMVRSYTDRLEHLLFFRRQWEEKGILPTEADLWPAPQEQPVPLLPDTLEELKKRKKNILSGIQKDQMMLDYGQKTRLEKKKPMPKGSKRSALENRITARMKLLDELNEKMKRITDLNDKIKEYTKPT